jgi:hypothetical protein
MSTTLSKGYKLPDTGDRGSSWFKDLEDNITRINSHDHDGTDAEKVLSKNITSTTSSIVSTDWGADSGGSTFSATVTFPTGITFENHTMTFIDDATGDHFFPTVTKASPTTMTVTVNDNTLDVTVIYG